MEVPINVKSPNNISKWQMGFNSAFKGLKYPETNILNNSTSTGFWMGGWMHRMQEL
jgi:hypothetical protein